MTLEMAARDFSFVGMTMGVERTRRVPESWGCAIPGCGLGVTSGWDANVGRKTSSVSGREAPGAAAA